PLCVKRLIFRPESLKARWVASSPAFASCESRSAAGPEQMASVSGPYVPMCQNVANRTDLEADPEQRRAATSVTVQTVEDATAFVAIGPHWNELLRASVSDNPFLTWEWLHSWWTHLRESSALRLTVVRSGDELIAIAPLRLASPASWFSRLEFLGTGYAGSD